MTKDAEIGSGTSFTTRLTKNFLASVNMGEDAEVGESDGGDDKIIKRLLFKKLSGLTRYITSLCSDADSAPFEKR